MNICLRNTAKKAHQFIELYNSSKNYDIFQTYTAPSDTKIKTFLEIQRYAYSNGYRDVKIISYNCQHYTVAYRNDDELVIETAYNRYIIKI